MPSFTPVPQLDLPRAVTAMLGLIAGYVDAVTFLGLFGFFIAQLTGSFVYVGSGLAAGPLLGLAQFLAVPVFFLAGVATTLTAELARDRAPLVWALSLEWVLLAAMTVIGIAGEPFDTPDRWPGLAVALLGVATMGVQSAQVRLLIRGAPSTNVMTTNTSQLAIDATQAALAALRRGASGDAGTTSPAVAAIRRRLAGTVLPMAGFFVGTVMGAVVYVAVGFIGLVLPLALLTALLIGVAAAKPGAARA